MIDIQLLRDHPDTFRESTKNKGINSKIVDEALQLDLKRRKLMQKVEELRSGKNITSRAIKWALKYSKSTKKPTPEAIKLALNIEEHKLTPDRVKKVLETKKTEAIEVKRKLDNLEPKLKDVEKRFKKALYQIPNPAASDVKVGKDENENEIVRTWGKPREFDFKPKDHLEIGEMLDIIDVKRAASVSGARFYYLKGDGARLEWALLHYAVDILSKEGFIPIVPPVIISRASMEGMGYLEHGGEEDMFWLEDGQKVLVGTSEQSIGPMHAGDVFDKKDLPLRYFAYSPCFRREAGSYGKDTRGILRVHQFNKIEMFSYTTAEMSDKEHEYLLSIEEKLFQALEIPYQVAKMCTGDLGATAARKYDIEAWMPGQSKYREVTSTSTTTDFQSRRLGIKYRDDSTTEYMHMLNGTAFATGRTIISILENYQEKDGSVTVPAVLRKYVGKDSLSI